LNRLVEIVLFEENGRDFYLLQYLLQVLATGNTLVEKNSHALLRTCAAFGLKARSFLQT
jgi:hypothetical protein